MRFDRKGVPIRPPIRHQLQEIAPDTGGKNSPVTKSNPKTQTALTAPKFTPLQASDTSGLSVKLDITRLHQTNPVLTSLKLVNFANPSAEHYIHSVLQVIATLPDGATPDDLIPAYVKAKQDQQAFAKLNAPLNHRICNCNECAGKVVSIKGVRKKGKVKVTGVWRCEHDFEPYCYYFDSAWQLKRAIALQEKWLTSGGEWYLLTFTCPHTWRSRLDELKDKLQLAFIEFLEEIKRLLPDVDFTHYIKRFEYAISRLNGHHPHIHIALGLKGVDDETVSRIREVMQSTWVKHLMKQNLVTKRTKASADKYAFDMRKTDLAPEYVAKRHTAFHLETDIPKILEKWHSTSDDTRDCCITIFEYMTLARYGLVDKGKFKQHYRQLLTAFSGVHKFVYSNGFEREFGLSEQVARQSDIKPPILPPNKPYEPTYHYQATFGFDEPEIKEIRYQKRRKGGGRKPKKPVIVEGQLTLPEIVVIYEQAIADTLAKKPKKPYWRSIFAPNASSNVGDDTLVIFDREVWKTLVATNAHHIVLSMIERDYKAGRFDSKPDCYYQQHPRPS